MAAENNFNLLRLLLAWSVIVSHSYELIDGNRSREPLTLLLGTLTAGEFAVNSFFVLSGFLICRSWLANPSALRFLWRRFARIVPGFVCCVTICALLYTIFFENSYLQRFEWPRFLGKLILLQAGGLPSAFPGSFYPVLNQSLWTIHFEFLCYFGLLLLGLMHLLTNKFVVPMWIVLVIGYVAYLGASDWIWSTYGPAGQEPSFVYYFENCLHFAGCYLSGVVWALNVGLVAMLVRKYWAIIGIAFVVLIVRFPLHAVASSILLVPLLHYFGKSLPPIRGFWTQHDISYGVYLYAWPIQKALMASLDVASEPLVLIALTSLLAICAGWLSWLYVERPAINKLKEKKILVAGC